MNPNEATELERSAADRTALLGMWAAFVNSRALQVVAELGIADELAAGPQDVSSLARKVRAHEGHLSRLLRTLSGAGAFAKDPQGVFRLTPRGEWLRSGVPRSVRDIVRMCDEALWNAFSALEYCVRTGKPAFERTAGTTFPEYLAAHPEASDRWDRGITALSADETQRVARACDLSHARRVIDIGGGQGGFLAEILSANEHLSGVLYDLPHVVSNPRALRESGMLGRCEVRGGDFLESPLPGGCDVHLIKRVLPGFDDECVVRVLSRCRAASPKDGRVLGIEALVLGGNHPHRARFSDVLMMVEGAGRERTEAEYRELYEKAGLEVRRVIPSGTSLSILEAVPCV